MIAAVRRNLKPRYADPTGPVTVLFRAGSQRWRAVAEVATYAEAVALVGTDGRHGDWWLKTLDRERDEPDPSKPKGS